MSVKRKQAAFLHGLVADNEAQRTNFEVADRDALALRDRLRELVSVLKEGRRDPSLAQLAAGAGSPELDAFRRAVVEIRTEEDRLLIERRDQAGARGWLTLGGTLLLVLTSSGFLLLAWRFVR